MYPAPNGYIPFRPDQSVRSRSIERKGRAKPPLLHLANRIIPQAEGVLVTAFEARPCNICLFFGTSCILRYADRFFRQAGKRISARYLPRSGPRSCTVCPISAHLNYYFVSWARKRRSHEKVPPPSEVWSGRVYTIFLIWK